MPDLAARLRDRIEKDGPLSFAAWMEACLYDPEDGYYMRPGRKTGAGSDADFATSPTLHPFMGRAVADEALAAWKARGSDGPLDVVEFGGGEGDLARAALARFDEVAPDADVRWTHVERSPVHRARQEGDPRLAWAEGCPSLPWAFVVAHEFVDALPFHVLEQQKGGWAELHVDVAEDRFVPTYRIPSPALLSAAPPATGTEPGQRVAVPMAARDWLQGLDNLEAADLLVVDYGGPQPWSRSLDGTVRTFRNHQDAGDPLEGPGDKDITASVDTDLLAQWAQELGWDPTALTSQEEWLLGHGILDALNAVPRDTEAGASQYLRMRQLLLPTGLGRAFFVQRFRR